jgi:cytochrome c oxidase assembly protein subunit 15
VAVLGAWLRTPRRRDLTRLSWGLVAGLVVEITLGALVVDFKLAPGLVTTHFLVGMAYFALALILHHRAGIPDDAGAPVRVVSAEQVILARLLGVAAAVVVALGTVVTSTGPHGGAPDAPRFAFSLHNVAQLHALSVEVFLAFTILTLWSMGRAGVPASVMRRGEILLVVLVLQGAVGYAQYLTGVPAVLVGIHVTGAVMVVAAVLHFNLGLSRYPQPRPEPLALAAVAAADLASAPA